ncbi:putative transporter in sor 3'region [Metallosphaera sp. J1]|uniref:DMT family transporter n=1 Tax=Metallosphaera TaxID=41980 RepID=UPI001EDEF78B|nr:EamA family transporter [Metallosphaera javensis (ex Hofmann et al. 2022)]MCG3109450.1 putative transporter in sor 3'region [Metallosphaera javensis (ex Hofmann et al. 2022)]BCS93520.1 MAG: EamA family transporter [Metallosphaera javensis (ex Sakai et al. 2022)]
MSNAYLKGFRWLGPLAIVWGLTYPLTKIVSADVSPLIITWVRFAVGALFFLIMSGFKVSAGRKQLITAIFNFTIFMLCLNVGTSISSNPGLAALMIYTQPIFVIIFERMLGTTISTRSVVGIVLGILGLALSITSASLDVGILIALIGGISWAVGTVYYSRNLTGESVPKLNAFMSLVSLPVALAVTPLDYYFTFTPLTLALLIALGVLGQAVGYILWFNALKEMGSIRASAGSLLVPIAAYILSFLTLGVLPSLGEAVGSVITLIGIYLTITSRK